jgi:ubiquinone/menaquinone biosynthesis C-methylase UbiE
MRELSAAACRQGELFGPGARDWAEEQEPVFRPLWEAALDAVRLQRGAEFLDAGCGTGGACLVAAERGAVVHGVDPSVNMLTIARERMPTADFRIGEIENLPFPNAQFDSVIASIRCPFATDPQLGMHELARVCRNGGRLAVVVPAPVQQTDLGAISEAILALLPERASPDAGIFSISAPGVLEALFDSVQDLRREGVVDIEAPAQYANVDRAVRGHLAVGPSQRAIEIHGRQRVADAVREALIRFERPDGTVMLRNRFRCAAGISTA